MADYNQITSSEGVLTAVLRKKRGGVEIGRGEDHHIFEEEDNN